MFSFFNTKEKKLRAIGFASMVDALQARKKNGEITKKEYKKIINQWCQRNEKSIENKGHIEVSARQSFDENEVLPPLNLQNIHTQVFDIDYAESLLLFEYKERKTIDQKIIRDLLHYHQKNNTTFGESSSLTTCSTEELLEIATSHTHPIEEVVAALQMLQR